MTGTATAHGPTLRVAEQGRRRGARCGTRRSPGPTATWSGPGGRLALTGRLAALLARTPAGLLPTVCYLCQGLIVPEFAGADLGLAEKLAVRAVATATGRPRCGSSPGSCWRSSALS